MAASRTSGPPSSPSTRRRKTASDRRAQQGRAQGRAIQAIVRALQAVDAHRGGELAAPCRTLMEALGGYAGAQRAAEAAGARTGPQRPTGAPASASDGTAAAPCESLVHARDTRMEECEEPKTTADMEVEAVVADALEQGQMVDKGAQTKLVGHWEQPMQGQSTEYTVFDGSFGGSLFDLHPIVWVALEDSFAQELEQARTSFDGGLASIDLLVQTHSQGVAEQLHLEWLRSPEGQRVLPGGEDVGIVAILLARARSTAMASSAMSASTSTA